MAKGSLSGVRKGKKGDSVYYRVAASNNKEKQGERQYTGVVTNPKTDAQVEQRMKMTPAVNFYRALKDDVLDHSFQGIKYGARSHSEFMKLAMLQPLGTLPYVTKGENQIIPAPYIISKGGMPDVGIYAQENGRWKSAINTWFTADYDFNKPFSEFVDDMLAANLMLKKGDQLTFIVICDNAGTTSTVVERLILDASKYTTGATAQEVLWSNRLDINASGFVINPYGDATAVAAGIILSRPLVAKTNGAVSWARSTSKIYVLPEYMATWQTEEKLNQAIESYKTKGANPSSDWYLNDGTLG